MGHESGISWTDSTLNPWIGCTKISPACDNCYAADWANRFEKEPRWGNVPRRRTSEKSWNNARRWQRNAHQWYAEHGRPRVVFCASLADVFDNQVPDEWRSDLWDLIRECDQLIWLLLTKRPQNIAKMLPADWENGWQNVWLGTTVENQEIAERNIGYLKAAPARNRFLSCEPLVGPILFDADLLAPIDWVIAGGESGTHARAAHPNWYRSIRDQCEEYDVPFHFKQWGEWFRFGEIDAHGRHNTVSRGKRPGEWIDLDGGEIAAVRIGKKDAGRYLDGKIHDWIPREIAD